MSHKNFRAIYTNCDKNFYDEFHLTEKNKKYTNENVINNIDPVSNINRRFYL